MRWFKHMTDASGDPFLAYIRDKWGMRGIGWYWTLLEIIAGRGRPVYEEGKKPTFSVGLSWKELARKLFTNRATLRQFLDHTSAFAKELLRVYPESVKLSYESSGEFLRLDCPNLLKIKDDYTRKSVHNTDQVGSRSGIEGKGYRKEERGKRGATSTDLGGPSSRPRSGEEIRKESVAHARNMTPNEARAALGASASAGIPLDPDLMEILQAKAREGEGAETASPEPEVDIS